jgi:hypothetical protein
VEIVSGMPEDSTFDEIVQELVFNRMVERGLVARLIWTPAAAGSVADTDRPRARQGQPEVGVGRGLDA